MRLKDYQEAAIRTAGNCTLPVIALGLCGEAVEVDGAQNRDDVYKELGDVCWYVAVGRHAIQRYWPDDLDSADVDAAALVSYGGEDCVRELIHACGRIADMVKKHVGHEHLLDVEKVDVELTRVLLCISCIAQQYRPGDEMTLHEILEGNVQKLKARYPKGVSSEASQKRSA